MKNEFDTTFVILERQNFNFETLKTLKFTVKEHQKSFANFV